MVKASTKVVFAVKGRFCDVSWHLAKTWDDEGVAIKEISRRLASNPSVVKYNLARPRPSERPRHVPPPQSNVGTRRRRIVDKLVQRVVRTSHLGGPSPRVRPWRESSTEPTLSSRT